MDSWMVILTIAASAAVLAAVTWIYGIGPKVEAEAQKIAKDIAAKFPDLYTLGKQAVVYGWQQAKHLLDSDGNGTLDSNDAMFKGADWYLTTFAPFINADARNALIQVSVAAAQGFDSFIQSLPGTAAPPTGDAPTGKLGLKAAQTSGANPIALAQNITFLPKTTVTVPGRS